MKLPNLAQPISRNAMVTPNSEAVLPSGINWGCVATNCGVAGLTCAASYLTGGIPAVITCLGGAAPSCIACFT